MIYHQTSYGVLPSEVEFKLLCYIPDDSGHVVAYDKFKVTNCKRVGTCVYSADELYKELCKAVQEMEVGDDAAGDWASCVLEVLGWGWV